MRSISTALLSLLLAMPVGAGQRPDFSGTWVLDAARSESALVTDGRRIIPPLSVTLEIAQSASEVRINAVRNGIREVRRYALQGNEAPREVGTSGSGAAVVESSPLDSSGTVETVGSDRTGIKWDGDAMVTTTPQQVNGMAVTTIERRTLSADGREMTVVTELVVQHGYEGAGRNVSWPARDVYVRRAH